LDRLDSEFDLLAASAGRTARVQRDEVKRFLEAAPQSSRVSGVTHEVTDNIAEGEPRRGMALAHHLHCAYDALIAHVEQRVEDFKTLPDPESKTGALTEMRQMVVGARNLHQSLSWLDAAANPPLDLGTRYLVDQLTATLVGSRAEVTVVAATDRSYATVTNPLRPVFELSGVPSSPSVAIIVVFVPRREQRSGLLHPLMVHELGHAANKQHGLVREVLGTDRGREQLSAVMGEATAQTEALPQGQTGDMTATVERIATRLMAWIEEALCDSIAAHILGPTYLYSFMAIVGTSDLEMVGEKHPTTRQRIRLLLEQLDTLGWAELMSAAPEIDDWFRAAAEEEEQYAEADPAFCAAALSSLSEQIVDVATRHVGDLAFRSVDYEPLEYEIDGLLKAGIPPSQTRERSSVGRAQIILGSWIFAVAKGGGNLDALALAADVPELSLLLPKALQDAALLEAWRGP